MNAIRVILAEDNIQQLEQLTVSLQDNDAISIIGTAVDGASAASMILNLHPDVAVFDLIMPRLDGFGLLTRIAALPADERPRSIIVSALTRSDFVSRAMELGASRYLHKPVNADDLARTIIECAPQTAPEVRLPTPALSAEIMTEDVAARYTSQLLIRLGISPHLNGHKFVHRAILLAIHRPEILNNMITELYPDVARSFDTTASRVERSIRFAVARTWDNGGASAFNKLLGRSAELSMEKPSNREFIALLAERVRIRKSE